MSVASFPSKTVPKQVLLRKTSVFYMCMNYLIFSNHAFIKDIFSFVLKNEWDNG